MISFKESNHLWDKFSRILAKFAKLNPREKSSENQFAKINPCEFILFLFNLFSRILTFFTGVQRSQVKKVKNKEIE